MALIVFYEKPGCINNTRQKQILRTAGAHLEERNLLTENWSIERLSQFFKGKDIKDWFNRSAPQIKSGAIDPDSLSADTALAAMVSDPLLIRRPLIEQGEFRCSGFVWPDLAIPLQLDHVNDRTQDLETCPRNQTDHAGCAPEEHTR